MAAYEIRDIEQFESLVRMAAKLKTLDKPMCETEPLFAGLQTAALEMAGV